MTDDQKYHEILKEIGRLIKEKNDMIVLQSFKIENLKRDIEKAEQKEKGN